MDKWYVAPRYALSNVTAVSAVAFAPDNKLIASAGGNEIKLWDIRTGRLIHTLLAPVNSLIVPGISTPGSAGSIQRIVFAPDGKTIIGGADIAYITFLWNVKTGKLLGRLKGDVNALAFSHNSALIAVGGGYDMPLRAGQDYADVRPVIRIWEASTGKIYRTLKGFGDEAGQIRTDDEIQVRTVAFSADGKTLMSAIDGGSLQWWDVKTGHLQRTLKHPASNIAFAPDAKTIATGGDTGSVTLWDAKTGVALWHAAGHGRGEVSVAFAPDNSLVASAAEEEVKLWDAKTGNLLHDLIGHRNWVNAVALSPDSKTLATGSQDTLVKVWNIAQLK